MYLINLYYDDHDMKEEVAQVVDQFLEETFQVDHYNILAHLLCLSLKLVQALLKTV